MRLSFLLGYPDSNQERQDQNLQCYHYTIAQYSAQKRCKDTSFLCNTNFLAHFLCYYILKSFSLLILQLRTNTEPTEWQGRKRGKV